MTSEHWLLIISLFTNFDKAVEIHSVEFNTKTTCVIAKADYKKQNSSIDNGGRLVIDCYLK